MNGRQIAKKIIGSVLALILVLGAVPVGLFYFSTPVIAEGSVIKISPQTETFVYSDAKNKNKSKLDEEQFLIGNYWNTYFKFDISALGSAKRSEISQAKLRLAVTWNGKSEPYENNCTFNVSFVDNNNWGDNMTWSSKPMGDEQYLCTSSGADANQILEIDLSDFIRKSVAMDKDVITLKLSPSVSNTAPIQIASSKHKDPTYRPYLKILIGDAVDPDSDSLNKSYLENDVYVSLAEPDMLGNELVEKNDGVLVSDSGSATYLKFSIDPKNIGGVVCNARLFLRPINKSTNTNIGIYYLDNDDWEPGSISYNSRPEENKRLIEKFSGLEVLGDFSVDVTDLIYELVEEEKHTISFLIEGDKYDESDGDSLHIYSSYSGELAPSLSVDTTDDLDTVAIREAIFNLKGKNNDFNNVTSDLPNRYVAQNGELVTIKWELNQNFSFENLFGFRKSAITNTGKINHPSLFEGEKAVQAKATLRVGNQTMTKFVNLTIMPEFSVPSRLQLLEDILKES